MFDDVGNPSNRTAAHNPGSGQKGSNYVDWQIGYDQKGHVRFYSTDKKNCSEPANNQEHGNGKYE